MRNPTVSSPRMFRPGRLPIGISPPWFMLLAAAMGLPASAKACPFCNAVSTTLSEEIERADVVVLARMAEAERSAEEAAPESAGGVNLPVEPAKTAFDIVQVLKGEEALGETRRIELLYFGQAPDGAQFLVFGSDPTGIAWSTPTVLSERAVNYVSRLPKLPKTGPERLAFFLDYLEDIDSLLAADTYDEFAKAPYPEVKQLEAHMQRDKLLGWIQNPDVAASRRRLYLTMLGICGQPEDMPILEEMLKSDDRQVRSALDAMIACYVILKGPDGIALVEELFFKNKDAEYTDTYSAIMAVRWLGQETEVVAKQRLMEALRYMLDRPELADLVIPDLARWQDWSVMEKLVTLFKEADDDSSWVRLPVVNYLRACPLPEAKQHLEELAQIDPETVKRANTFFPLAARPKPAGPAEPGGPAEPAADATTPDPTVTAPATKDSGASDPAEAAVEQPAEVDSAGLGAPAATTPTEPMPGDSAPTQDPSVASTDPQAAGAQPDEIAAAEPAEGVPAVTGAKKGQGDQAASTVASRTADGSAESAAVERQAGATQAAAARGKSAPASASPVGVVLFSLGAGIVVLLLLVVILRGGRGEAAA